MERSIRLKQLKIYGNEELLRLRTKIDEYTNKFSQELETVNIQFTPIFIRLKKKRSNVIYYIVLTLFLLFFISFSVFLGVLEAFYLILIVYGINLVLTGAGLLILKKVNKEYKIVKDEWDKEYKKVLKYQEEANKLYDLAAIEVYKVITLTLYHEDLLSLNDNKPKYEKLYNEKLAEVKASIDKELGSSNASETVVSYYINWGEAITNQNKSDFDYLEARRRKAILSSKDIDIDSKGE